MMTKFCRTFASITAIGLGASGCASFTQDRDEVLVRDPAQGKYGAPEPVAEHAGRQWLYAAMSDHVYEAARSRAFEDRGKSEIPAQPIPEKEIHRACNLVKAPPIPDEWRRWTNFPSEALSREMRKNGLFLLVFEKETPAREIVVVFEGTNFTELPDWGANLRWFWRFIPGYTDQYTITASKVGKEFHERLLTRPDKYKYDANDEILRTGHDEPIRIVATGHSLGGGLAQHFAYTVRQDPPGAHGPRVSEVFAFDPTPVTGWFSADDPPRTHNARGLRINRIFEHGEILAYLRLLTSRLVSSHENPAIWEYRYNFNKDPNLIRNHSMRRLACGLYLAGSENTE